MGKFDIKKLITEELNAALEEELKNSDDFEITSDFVSLVRFIRGGQVTEVVFKDPKIAENITMRWSSVSNKLRVIAFYDENTIQLHTEQLVHYALNQLIPKDGNKIIYTRPKENMIEGEQRVNEGTKDWSQAKLDDRELAFVVALYNNYSGEPKRTVDNYQSINLESAKMYFDEYINGTESSPVGLKAARKILTKLWKINEKTLDEGRNYTSDSVREFVEKNDISSIYKPMIQLHGQEFNTKYLSVEWEVIEELIRILEK